MTTLALVLCRLHNGACMRRAVSGLILVVLLTCGLLLPAAAFASTASQATLLATEGGEVGGLTPQDPNSTDNEFAPAEYEGNFLWGGAVGILALLVVAVGGVGGLYYLLVVKAGEQASA